MSVRSFHSVFMATAVAGAALGCYLVSLRVASERAALEQVEQEIVQAQRDIRLLQTEIGTRARLAQLERWNVRVLALSAPSAEQILGDKFQLARLVRPEERTIDAPIVLAAAPVPERQQPFATQAVADEPSPAPQSLLHEASARLPARDEPPIKPSPRTIAETVSKTVKPAPSKAAPPKAAPTKDPVQVASSQSAKSTPSKRWMETDKSGDEKVKPGPTKVTAPVRTAKADPLAPLPGDTSKPKASRTQR